MKLLPSGANEENRKAFFAKLDIDNNQVFSADLTHSSHVQKVSVDGLQVFAGTDALVAVDKNCFLSVTVADCLPILFFESQQKIVGVAHAGWRGLLGGIVENTIAEIVSLGGSPKNLQVALGSAIAKCHFEIKEDVLENFKEYADFVEKQDGKYFVDMKGIAKNKLINQGIPVGSIEDTNHCTYSDQKLFSYRRDKPEIVEAQIVLIGMV